MPGHKRKGQGMFEDISRYDITEITGYDNLHDPEGIIRDSMNELKRLYHTRESWYLVNGSTVGILAAVSACCDQGDGILISRNCHKSVYNAIRLLHLKAYYFMLPVSEKYNVAEDMTEDTFASIREILSRHADIRAVVLPSPTYEGVVMNIRGLKEIVREFSVPMIVDEAHGAHFIFHSDFPESAVSQGADIVVQSTHKTLPALTQTALLHLCSDRIPANCLADMLSIYESSSPSYLLMSSAEYAVHYMRENEDKVDTYVNNLHVFRKKCGQLHRIHLIKKEDLHCFDYDEGKLVFSVEGTGVDGIWLFDRLLKKYHIELEMSDCSNCIAMTSVCDKKEDFQALFQALKEIDEELRQMEEELPQIEEELPQIEEGLRNIDEELRQKEDMRGRKRWNRMRLPEKRMESWECSRMEKEAVSPEEAVGRISGEYVMLYPPGIPILVPGEIILKETVENVRYSLYNGYNVLGLSQNQFIVLKNRERAAGESGMEGSGGQR